jgi:hypothetical protein
MTIYQFNIVIPASGANPVNLAAAAIAANAVLPGSLSSMYSINYLPSSKLRFQMAKGGTEVGYVGGATVKFDGSNAMMDVIAATVSVPGGFRDIESQQDTNSIQLSQFYVHGGNAGDVMLVTYTQS